MMNTDSPRLTFDGWSAQINVYWNPNMFQISILCSTYVESCMRLEVEFSGRCAQECCSKWHTDKFWPGLIFGPGFNFTSPLKMTYSSQIHKWNKYWVKFNTRYGICKPKKMTLLDCIKRNHSKDLEGLIWKFPCVKTTWLNMYCSKYGTDYMYIFFCISSDLFSI